ncbi:SapB/AmfS family lanthipeptide [Streptomyces sp. NPDC002537]
MALLDLQNMESEEMHGGGDGDGGGLSTVSLLSCISAASVLLCL